MPCRLCGCKMRLITESIQINQVLKSTYYCIGCSKWFRFQYDDDNITEHMEDALGRNTHERRYRKV